MFLELHVLQNFVPSNLNRDDTGSPKDCDFGGYRRGRISSQCFKRSIRKADVFSQITGTELSNRTKLIYKTIRKSLIEKINSEDKTQDVLSIILPLMFSDIKENDKMDTLLFIGSEEANMIAISFAENWEELSEKPLLDKKKKPTALTKKFVRSISEKLESFEVKLTPDVALFGRMLARMPKANIDAACQVAHAISTNKLNMEFDYFTAVDDLQAEDETGSAHLDTTQFNSSCYYRYSNIDLEQLKKNLAEDEALSRKTVEAFIRASVEAIPTGKQNAFAARQKPEFILAIIRDDMPVNLANAFEKPVQPTRWQECEKDKLAKKPVQPPRNGVVSLVENSITVMDDYYKRLVSAYGEDGVKAKAAVKVTEQPKELKGLNVKPDNFETLVKTVMAEISFA